VEQNLQIAIGARMEAWVVKQILARETGEVVGWLYEWNTGERVPMWKSGAYQNVIYA
jgi:hypothetical protein